MYRVKFDYIITSSMFLKFKKQQEFSNYFFFIW